MHRTDINDVAKLHSQQFGSQHHSKNWVSCNFAAFPRIMIFVARNEKDQVIGYIQWTQKGGFCQDTIIELEHVAVYKDPGISIREKLINESLSLVKDYLNDDRSTLTAILIITRATDEA